MAKDIIHDPVKNALIKDGWTIVAEQFQVEYEELEIFADIVAERSPLLAEKNGRKIIVEIKTFAGRSFMREFEQAIGQYEVYLEILELAQLHYELYMAISELAYETFFQRKGTSTIVERKQLKLCVVDVMREEVVTWQP